MSPEPGATPPVRYEANLPPHMRRWVTYVLRGGVILASSLLVIGLVLWAIDGTPSEVASGGVTGTTTLAAGIASGSAFAFLLLGLLVLVLTPLARVIVSLALFSRARDRAFVALTAFVMVVLLLSVLLGVVGL